jgi:hypothetical protein
LKIKYLLLILATLYCVAANADVQTKVTCYAHAPRSSVDREIDLVLHVYVDNDLKKEVGSFVQYSVSKEAGAFVAYSAPKEPIPLIFTKYVPTDTDSPDLGNYDIYRTEIFNNKVTGQYVFGQTGAGIRQGKYATYKNFRTGKTMSFEFVGDKLSDCNFKPT